MLLQFQILFHALVFLALLETIAAQTSWILYLGVFVLLTSVLGIRAIAKRFIFIIIPTIFSLAAVMMLYLIDAPQEQQVFILLATSLYYLGLLGIYRLRGYGEDQTARGMVAASAMAGLFFFYTAAYGIYLNFAIPLWVLMVAFLAVTVLVSYEYFGIINKEKKELWNYSLILGMAMAEVAWVVSFWPFGYLSTGAVVLLFYYLFWDLTQAYFLDNLSQKRLVSNVVFLGALVGLILATSEWLPIV